MSRTVNITDEIIVVSHGEEDTGKMAMLGAEGKFHKSVIPVIDDLQEQITKEVTERTEGDKALQINIDAEVSTRTTADRDLQEQITKEVTERTEGDKALQTSMDAEVSTRTISDQQLQDQLNKEVTERTEGDKALQTSMDAEFSARTISDQQLQDQLNKEVTERTEGDKALQTSMDAEFSARTVSDQQLQDQINKEVTERTEGDKALQSNIDAEFSARTVSDQQLQDQLNKEVTERTEGDKALQYNMDAEVSARTASDQGLQDQIDKEVLARGQGDKQLQENIDAEVSTRTTADKDLQEQITAEITARISGDETESNTRLSADQNLQEQIKVLNGKNAFSNVAVNGTTIQAASQEDTIELKAGTNIALTADTGNKKVTIAVTGKVVSAEQADSAMISKICTGNAASAAKLETARNINGVPFDGSADITITQVEGKTIATIDQIPATSASIPVGGIIMWSGAVAEIPTHWALCNGENNTPNLLNRMVVCAGASYTVGTTGGSASHVLTVDEIPSHCHIIPGDDQYLNAFQASSPGLSRIETISNWDWDSGSSSYSNGWYNPGRKGYTGGNGAHNNMPPYYALAYIMRIA